MITLTDSTTTITLSPDFYWKDEHDWQAVEQKKTRTLTGALLVEEHARLGGRPITLEPPDDTSAWINKSDLEAIRAFAAVPGKIMTLSIHGNTYSVMFDRQSDGAVSAKPVVFFSDASGADFYLATLKLMEVQV